MRSSLLSVISTSFILLLGAASNVSAATISAGDLIKASGQAVYYLAQDGKRYVFPNEKTYFTWYTDFSTVKTITDTELSAISIGGNATYRPGSRLLKITSDPRTYAIEGKTLRPVASEEAAKLLFGYDWAKKVDDLPEAFFINYKLGSSVEATSNYQSSTEYAAHPSIQTVLSESTQTVVQPIITAPIQPQQPTPDLTERINNLEQQIKDLTPVTSLVKIELSINPATVYYHSNNELAWDDFASNATTSKNPETYIERSAQIIWTTQNAVSCTASGNSRPEWRGSKPTEGSEMIVLKSGEWPYTLTCKDASGVEATITKQLNYYYGL